MEHLTTPPSTQQPTAPASWWWTAALILLGFPMSAQWVHEWTRITVDGQTAFTLSDSSAVHAERAAKGYHIQKRVWVEKSAVSQSELAAQSTLYTAQGKAMGQTLIPLALLDQGVPSDRRMAKKYVTGLIQGEVNSSAFISNSWPERSLVEFLTEKRVGPFWDNFSAYLDAFGFEKVKPQPEDLSDAGIDTWVLRYADARNQDEQRFRMIIFTRGEVGIQCVLTHEETLDLPKIKLFEEKAYGQLHHLSKPTTTQSSGYEYAAYAFIPLED